MRSTESGAFGNAETTLSRRHVLAGGIALTCFAVPALSQAAATPRQVLRAQPISLVLRNSGAATSSSGFNGTLPGPVLRGKAGTPIDIRLSNELAEPVALRWHGLRLPNDFDQLVQPPTIIGLYSDYRLVPPDAGTFFYRPSSPNVRGLYGPIVIDEASPPRVDHDVVLMLDDWRLRDDGNVDETNGNSSLTVNGTLAPSFEVNTNERLRLRLINAGSRMLTLRVESHDVRVMGIDGQPAQPFFARDSRVALSPGNRIDLFIDALLTPSSSAAIVTEDAGREIALARLAYGPAATRPAPLPTAQPLPTNPLPEKIDLAGSLKVIAAIGDTRFWKPAGTDFSGTLPRLFEVKRGRAVSIAFSNPAATARVVHPHGHSMRLLDNLDDGWKPFWLDTLLVDAGNTTRIAFVADNPGKWLIEARTLNDRGSTQAAWFEVS